MDGPLGKKSAVAVHKQQETKGIVTRGSCDVESITRMILQKTEEGELCYVEEVGEEEKHDGRDEEEEDAQT